MFTQDNDPEREEEREYWLDISKVASALCNLAKHTETSIESMKSFYSTVTADLKSKRDLAKCMKSVFL